MDPYGNCRNVYTNEPVGYQPYDRCSPTAAFTNPSSSDSSGYPNYNGYPSGGGYCDQDPAHYSTPIPQPFTWMGNVSETLLSIEWEQSCQLNRLSFRESGVAFVYNPLEYAFETHADYVRKYCQTTKQILFLGMNPGPFGMAQNGIPFGEVNVVKDWLKINGRVGKPIYEHPLRAIQGMNCTRSEVSGHRFWGLLQELCELPGVFFQHCFVHNYCPLSFMLDSGKNVTPPELKAPEKNPLFDICDDSLCKIVHLLNPQLIIGIGKFAEERAARALGSGNIMGVRVSSILHPSPVSPAANKGWKEKVLLQLNELGVMHYLKPI